MSDLFCFRAFHVMNTILPVKKCLQPIYSLPDLPGQKPKAHYYFTFSNSTIFVFMEFLWDQPVLSYSTHESQKSGASQKNGKKNHFSKLNFEVLLINRSFWNFLWLLQFAWISNCEFIKILHVHFIGMKYELAFMKWRPKMIIFSVFCASCKIDWINFLFVFPPEKIYDIWPNPTKISSKSIKLLLNKILWHFHQIGK